MKAGPKTGWRHGDFTDNSVILTRLDLIKNMSSSEGVSKANSILGGESPEDQSKSENRFGPFLPCCVLFSSWLLILSSVLEKWGLISTLNLGCCIETSNAFVEETPMCNGHIYLTYIFGSSFFLSFNLTSIPGPERSIWPSWFEQNAPIVQARN